MSMKSQCKLAGCLLLLMQLPAWGQDVALTGVMGQRALLVINGGTPAVENMSNIMAKANSIRAGS